MSLRLSQTESALYANLRRTTLAYDLIAPGDRILVAVSGGKDSYGLLHLLRLHQRRAPLPFSFVAVHLDQGQPGYDGGPLAAFLAREGYEHHILHRDTYSVVKDKTQPGQAYCFLCARLRRGILYKVAEDLGCQKIALGHHREDTLETLLMNLVFTGQLKAMPPRLLADNGKFTLIRPLLFCPEDGLRKLAEEHAFPILPCNLCGTQDNLQRQAMRRVIEDLETAQPGAKSRMLAALTHVRPAHLLDRSLQGLLTLQQDATDERDENVEPQSRRLPVLPNM